MFGKFSDVKKEELKSPQHFKILWAFNYQNSINLFYTVHQFLKDWCSNYCNQTKR